MISEEKREYNRKYYIANKEKHNARMKKYHDAHKEEILRAEVCQIIKKHKEDLADDPERLSTDFILKLVNKH